MPEFTLEFEVYCAKCGAGLCNQSSTQTSTRRGMPSVQVEPCEKCLSEAKDEGDSEGHDRGHTEGYAKGETEGESNGYARGIQEMQDKIDAALL